VDRPLGSGSEEATRRAREGESKLKRESLTFVGVVSMRGALLYSWGQTLFLHSVSQSPRMPGLVLLAAFHLPSFPSVDCNGAVTPLGPSARRDRADARRIEWNQLPQGRTASPASLARAR